MKQIKQVYFSPTHTTKTIINRITNQVETKLRLHSSEMDLTLPKGRQSNLQIESDQLLIFGFPVYAGRIPVVLNDVLTQIQGQNAKAVIIAVYGNRDYDDAILEASDRLTEQGFNIIAAAAFIGQHSIVPTVAASRPDQDDLEKADLFAKMIIQKIIGEEPIQHELKGHRPYRQLPPANQVKPKTTNDCNGCLICANGCPMGVISNEDPSMVAAGCIRCCACVKFCPVTAKYFDDDGVVAITQKLETYCMARREPEYFR